MRVSFEVDTDEDGGEQEAYRVFHSFDMALALWEIDSLVRAVDRGKIEVDDIDDYTKRIRDIFIERSIDAEMLLR